jgi:outer membrane protein assembly factor BamB
LDHPEEFKKLFDLGDDTDSTISFDKDGTFYVGIEVDKRKNGSGTVYKIDAKSAKVLWSWSFRAGSMYGGAGANPINGGILSSAAIWPEGNLVFYTTSHDPTIGMGRLVALNRQTGRPVWTKRLRSYSWSSPIVFDGVLVACDAAGSLYILDARNGSNLISGREYFSLGANVEGSPIVFDGRIYVGVRGGATVCLGIR